MEKVLLFQAQNKSGKLQPLEKGFAKDYFSNLKLNEMPTIR